MTNTYTLDELNKTIESKYAPFHFQAGKEKFVLRQVLRLSSAERATVVNELKKLDAMDEDNLDEVAALGTIEAVLSTITEGDKGPKLIEILGHDLLRVQMLLEMWIEATQPGEASPSPA